jgi:capsular polysaccharide transport system permease protein
MLMETAVDPQKTAKVRFGALITMAHKNRWIALFVVLPILISTLYYAFIASDIYVSEARFAIKSPGQRQTQVSALASLVQSTGLTTGQEQANEVVEFLRSRDALKGLERSIDLRTIYTAGSADPMSRFPKPFEDPAFENLFEYYGKMVRVKLDTETNVVVLESRAFRPNDAQLINTTLLSLSEDLVNRLNSRAQRKAIEENIKQVEEAKLRLSAARVALREYRNQEQLLDPDAQGAGVLQVSNELVAVEAALKAQLQQMERAAPRNPSLPALRARIAAVSAQIAAQTGRAVGTKSGIASKLTEYERLFSEQQFATQMLTVASTGLEQARADAQKQQFYLERVVEPNTPDLAQLPNRIRQILTIAAIALCLYLIGWMLIVGILEHAPED